MGDFLDKIKPRVRQLSAYTLKPAKARVKLNQNENPWELPGEIKQQALRKIGDSIWSRYPDFIPTRLHQRLAEHSGWIADGVLAGNGSNEMIQALLMVTVGEGKRVLINEPTFTLYRQLATVLGADVISVPLTPALGYDLPAIKAVIAESNPDVLIICSPNNPTGCVISQSELVSLLDATSGVVAIDEAYFEFANQTAVPLLEQYSNLVVLRTFSKAMALAGLRVGYLLASPKLAREVSKAVLPYNLNILSQTTAEVCMDKYEEEILPLIRTICSERDRLFLELERIEGLEPVSSRANFMVVKSRIPPAKIFNGLLERDILIRDVSGYPMLSDYFRISVGTPEENDRLIKALRELFELGEKA